MTDQSRTISLVILAIIAVTAIIGLVLLFKMSATGDVAGQIITKTTTEPVKKRAVATQGSATYMGVKTWGSAISAPEVFQVKLVNIFGIMKRCYLVTLDQVTRGVMDMDKYNNMDLGCTAVVCEGVNCRNCVDPACIRPEVQIMEVEA